MCHRAFTTLLLLGLAALLPTRLAPANDAKADVEAGKMLLAEGDRLADQGRTADAVLKYEQAFEHLLPAMRKLPFRREVRRDVTLREQLKDVVLQEIDRDMTPEEFRAGELGMKALGLIPRELDLKSVLVHVYADEIAAFYDPRTKTMHLIEEPKEGGPQPSFLERLLGKTGGFDKDENKTILAHELTHALADQHYDLKALQDAVKRDDDRSLALSALIEGEATLTMTGAQMDDWDGAAISKLPAEDLDRAFSLFGAFLPALGGKNLRAAPPVVRESLIFPYLRGLVFCAKLANDGDWKAINGAYCEPPRSTEQILHPEKYRANPDAPMDFDLGRLDPGAGWNEVGRNVVGELQTAILLRDSGGRRAAAGWDGDRYAVFEGPEGRLGLVWRTTWDSEDDAREFAQAYARFQTSKLGDGAAELEGIPDSLRRSSLSGADFAVERRGPDVTIVEGFSFEATDRLLGAAREARAFEKPSVSAPRCPEPEQAEAKAGN